MARTSSDRKSTAAKPPPYPEVEPKIGPTPNGSGEGIETNGLGEGIPKPNDDFNPDDFKSETDTAGVGALLRPLPHHSLAAAGDFVRLHPDEKAYWSPELCFVKVPILGQKRDTLHLIKKEVAIRNQVRRLSFFRLALATKPGNQFFLCQVPSRNLENAYNRDAIDGCQQAKTRWIQADSKQKDGSEGYYLTAAHDDDAFLEPTWPTEGLWDLIELTFDKDRRITHDDHPALLRILGRKQSLS